MANLYVSNQSELNAAVNAMKSGDTVHLAPGTYSKLQITERWNKSYDFDEKVTFTSTNPSNPAVIREVFVRDASNIELSELRLDYSGDQPSGTPSFLEGRPFFFEDVNGLTIDDVTFSGHVSGGVGKGRGLRVKNSDDVVVTDSRFSDFHDGIDFINVDDAVVSRNQFRGMANDGMSVGGMHGITISDNDFRAFRGPTETTAHRDAIQFRSGPSEGPSSDIVIRDNTIVFAEVMHSIWMGNELHRDGDWDNYHRDILIEGNYIRSAQGHGISVYHGDGVTIRNNTLVRNTDLGYDDYKHIPLVNVSKFSINVAITGNTVHSVQRPQNSTWTVSGNDTNVSNFGHWDGNYPDGTIDPNAPYGEPEINIRSEIVIGSVSGEYVDEEMFRIDARRMDGDTRFIVERLNFGRDDELVLTMFDEGTFTNRGVINPVWIWNEGASAKIDSVFDLVELAVNSPDVTAETDGDELTLYVARGGDVAEIVLENLGDEYRAFGTPELF